MRYLENNIKLINNEVEINNADQYNRRNNTELKGIPQPIKSEYLEDRDINLLVQVNIKVNKNNMEACHRLGDSRRTTVGSSIERICFKH